MTFDRELILKTLVETAKNWPNFHACWEGGAIANNRLDQFSDIDFNFCVADDSVEESLKQFEVAIDKFVKIEHRWRVPEPTWHGHSQCFYKISGAPEYFFIDVVFVKASAANKYLERERHGNPVVHFDKTGVVKIVSADTEEFRQKMASRLKVIQGSFPIFKSIVVKELLREKPLDALAFYRTLVGYYIELLGMKHRPFHFDFGLRYIHSEFSKEIQNEIMSFSYVSDLNAIRKNLAPISSKIETLLDTLERANRTG